MQEENTGTKQEVAQEEQNQFIVESVEDDMKKLGIEVEEPQKAENDKESSGAIEKDEKAKEEKAKDEAKEEAKEEEKPKKLTRAERRIRRQQERIKELEKKLAEQQAQSNSKPKEIAKPDIDNFDTYEEYEQALNEYESKISESVDKSEAKKEEQPQELSVSQEEIKEVLDYGIEKYEDFKDVVMDDTLPLTNDMLDVAFDSDVTEDILYFLGTNREKAQKIAQLSPKQIAKEIGKIEAKIEDGRINLKGSKKKKETKAPEPIKPVNGSGATPKSLDDDDLSYQEYEELLNKQRRKSYTGFL